MQLSLDLPLLAGARAPALAAALAQLAQQDATARGAVFTRRAVVDAILDLVRYTPDRPLHRQRLLEPAFGSGEFLLPVVDRLLSAWRQAGGDPGQAELELKDALRAVELHPGSYERTTAGLEERLCAAALPAAVARRLCTHWLQCDDFLLCDLPGRFDYVVGNPPYVRQERIPGILLAEYRRRFRTLYDRADLYVLFFERALDLLAHRGVLGFICANRWLKNHYGGPLRRKIARNFALTHYINMDGRDAFHSEVIAYPAISIIRRPETGAAPVPTRVALWAQEAGSELSIVPQHLC